MTNLGEGDFTSNHGGIEGEEDVIRSRRARRRFPLRIECKNTHTLELPRWIRQLDADAKASGDRQPGAVFYTLSGSGGRVRVDLDLYALLELVYGPFTPEDADDLRKALRPAHPR